MESNGSSRRRFLTQTAALAGVAAGAGLAAKPRRPKRPRRSNVHNEPPKRGARYTIDHMTHYTPLQDYNGVITPSRLHFMQQHTSEFPVSRRIAPHALDLRPGRSALALHRRGSEAAAVRIARALPRVPCQQLARDPQRRHREHGPARPVHPRDDELQRMDRRPDVGAAERSRREIDRHLDRQ